MLQHHLEVIAKHTWQTLNDSRKFGISQGEETINDNILLYLLRQRLPSLHLIKTPKNKEAQMGTDWEWWIGNPSEGYLRYAVQAKKLNFDTRRYGKLKHLVPTASGNEFQHEILKKFAIANNAIPLYALYNNISLPVSTNHWHCGLALDHEQFGITVTSLNNIEYAINNRGCRSFDSLHLQSQTLPIRCLANCPPQCTKARKCPVSKWGADGDVRRYSAEELRPILGQRDNSSFMFPAQLYDNNIGIYPRHILFFETEA